MFLDLAKIFVKSGDGGDGAVAFRREKFVPKGGPAGGDGGNGGNIVFLADRNKNTLLDFKYKRKFVADSGAQGGNSLKDGKSGKDIIIKVPVGTLIKDESTGELLHDLDKDELGITLLKGGRGGKGNSKFATATNQTPRFAENGKPGEEKSLLLELKLLADVGLVGFPNAGKSTLISSISAAKPKIADYPFTTLEPNLGIVDYKDYHSFTVADIPGIIEGAHEGKGLGHKFLKHIERTKILLIMIDSSEEHYQKQYDTLLNELNNFGDVLSGKKKLIGFSKIDMLPSEEREKLKRRKISGCKEDIIPFSSVSREGIDSLLDTLWLNLSD